MITKSFLDGRLQGREGRGMGIAFRRSPIKEAPVSGQLATERVRLRALTVVPCFLLGTLAAPLGAQDSVLVIPNAVACATCSLKISAIVELGDREGPGIVGEQAYISQSDDGDYYVSSFVQEGRLLRFSADGVFQDAIGRSGEGPGEYTLPMLIAGSADDLTILDIRSFRLTTIRDGEVATARLPFMAGDVALLANGQHIYSAVAFQPDRIGHPLHLYDVASGRITRSFGDEGVRVDRSFQSETALDRRVAAAPDGNVWAARVNRYRIDKWSPDGDRIARIERDPSWFDPWVDWPVEAPLEDKALPELVGIRDWGDDLLMVVVRVADADWRPMRAARIEQDHEVITGAQFEELYDTVIEILDTRSGTVVARTQVDASVWGLIGQDGFHSYAEHSELGEPKHIVWSVALSGYSR